MQSLENREPIYRTYAIDNTPSLIVIHDTLMVLAFSIGLILLMGGETFNEIGAYKVMARLASEYGWGYGMIFTSIIGLVGHVYPNKWVKVFSSLVMSTAHGAIAVCVFLANPFLIGTVAYTAVAWLGYYLSWRRASG